MKEESKRIRIQEKIRKRTYDEIRIPEIRLEGLWLKRMGFHSGQQVQVNSSNSKIIITLVSE